MIKICCLSNDQSKTMLKFFKSPGADLLRISNELQLEFIIEKVCWQMSNYENWSNCNCNWFQLENLAIDGIDHDWWTGATDAGHEGTWTWDDQEDHDNPHHQDHQDNATKESHWSMLVGWTMRRWWRTFCGRQTNQAVALSRFSFCEISSDICKIFWISRTAWCWKTAGNSWDTPSIAHQGPDNQKESEKLKCVGRHFDPFLLSSDIGEVYPICQKM